MEDYVLITGLNGFNGFIGQHVAQRLLKDGWRLLGVSMEWSRNASCMPIVSYTNRLISRIRSAWKRFSHATCTWRNNNNFKVGD